MKKTNEIGILDFLFHPFRHTHTHTNTSPVGVIGKASPHAVKTNEKKCQQHFVDDKCDLVDESNLMNMHTCELISSIESTATELRQIAGFFFVFISIAHTHRRTHQSSSHSKREFRIDRRPRSVATESPRYTDGAIKINQTAYLRYSIVSMNFEQLVSNRIDTIKLTPQRNWNIFLPTE